MRYLILALVQLGLVGICVALARHYLDIPQVLAAFAKASPLEICMAVATQCVITWPLSLLRLLALCRFSIPWATGLAVLSLGQFLNVMLPIRLGEAGRVALLARSLGNDLSQATEITFWERFGDLNVLLMLLLLAGPAMGGVLAISTGAATLGFWAGVLALKAWGGPLHKLLARLPWPRISAYLVGTAGAIRVRLTPGFAVGLALLSLLPWAVQTFVQGYVLCAVFQLQLSPLEVVAVVSAGIAGQAVPVTPGGIGIYESTVVATLTALGQPMEQALAAALAMHAVILLPKLLAGAWSAYMISRQAILRV